MAGLDKPGSDRPPRRPAALLTGDLKDRVIAALLAVVAGVFGTAGFLNLNPPRPDPWTATDAKDAHKVIEARIDRVWDELMRMRREFDAHEREAAHAVSAARVATLEKEVDALRKDHAKR